MMTNSGVAQSDWQYHAVNGSSKWEGKQFSNDIWEKRVSAWRAEETEESEESILMDIKI